MSEWAMYVKHNYDSVRHLPARERFAALAKMRKGEGMAKTKGGYVDGAATPARRAFERLLNMGKHK